MKEKKYYLALDEYEQNIVIRALNELRNALIAEGKYTDAVDELIVKTAYAPNSKFKL